VFRTIARNGALARFLAGEFLSSIGDWLYLVALLVFVYQTTKSPFLLALVGAARTVPAVVLSIPAGFVVDRVDRRRLLIGTDLIRAGLMVVIGSLVLIGAPIATVVGIGLFSSVFTTLNRPAFGAYLPSLVRDETELGPANSAWSSLDSAAFIVGPAIAGLLVAWNAVGSLRGYSGGGGATACRSSRPCTAPDQRALCATQSSRGADEEHSHGVQRQAGGPDPPVRGRQGRTGHRWQKVCRRAWGYAPGWLTFA